MLCRQCHTVCWIMLFLIFVTIFMGLQNKRKEIRCLFSPDYCKSLIVNRITEPHPRFRFIFKAAWLKKDVLLLFCRDWDDNNRLITYSIPENKYSFYGERFISGTTPEGLGSDGKSILLYDSTGRRVYVQKNNKITKTVNLGKIVDEKKLTSPLVKVRIANSSIIGDILVFSYIFFDGDDVFYILSEYSNLPNGRVFSDSFTPFLKQVQTSPCKYLYLQKDKELYEYSTDDNQLTMLFKSPSKLTLQRIERYCSQIYFSGFFDDILEKKLKERDLHPSVFFSDLYKYDTNKRELTIFMKGVETFDRSENYFAAVRTVYPGKKNRKGLVSILSIFDNQGNCMYRKEFTRRLRMAPFKPDIIPMISDDEKYVVFLHEGIMETDLPLVVKTEDFKQETDGKKKI